MESCRFVAECGIVRRAGFDQVSPCQQRFGIKLNSCKGMVAKASSKVDGTVGLDRIGTQNGSLYRISEKLGTGLGIFRRYSRLLDAVDDEYDGVVIDSERLPENPATFIACLRASLAYWRLKGKKGVWLKLPRDQSDLVPVAVKEGFEYHHAEKGYVMLTYWIPEGQSMLPANASHSVGVGGFVINDNNEVLVVQEKYCDPAFRNCWKLPTGYIHECEEIYSGAVREVKEETGIDTEFVEVIAFRHAHNVAFEKSDLFFICMLRPLSTEINVDDLEIQAAKWMPLDEFVQPLDEFVQQPIVQSDNMFNKIIGICQARLKKHYCGLTAHTVVSKFDSKSSSLYYNTSEDGSNSYSCITDDN